MKGHKMLALNKLFYVVCCCTSKYKKKRGSHFYEIEYWNTLQSSAMLDCVKMSDIIFLAVYYILELSVVCSLSNCEDNSLNS